MSNPKVIFTAIAAMMIISSFALVMNTNASDSDPGGEPEGQQWEEFLVNYGTRTFDDDWIPISNINDLQDISDLAGKYYLTNNIDLTNYYLSDSFDIKIDPSYDDQAEELTVTLSIIATDKTVIPMHVSDIVMFVNGEEKEQTAGEAKVVFNVDPAVNDLLITAAGTVTNVDPTYDNTFVVSESFNMRDLVPVTINSKGNFTPIGSSASPFKGTIDGNGYSIIGLRTTSYVTTSDAYSGLIAYADGAIINNLGLEGGGVVALLSNIDRWACAGGLIGYADSTIITNSYNRGIVTASSSSYQAYAGGLIGNAQSTIITNSYNGGIVTVSSSVLLAGAGGLIGSAGSTSISNSYNSGIITAISPASESVGGLIGSAGSTSISNSYNTGIITATLSTSASAGGLIGSLYAGKPIINSYNTGTITALSEADVGGLVGFSWNTTLHSSYAMEITDSYTKLVGGRGTTILEDYDPNVPDPDGMKTTTEMKDQETFYGWNFDTIWAIDTSGAENGGYPYLDPIGRWMDFIVDEGEGYDPRDAGGEWIELNNENFMDVMQDESIDLAANYYLSENIDLTNVGGKGSFEIVVEPIVGGDELTVTLKHGDNAIEVSEGSISINGKVTILDEEVATASHEMEDGIKEFRIVAGGIATNVTADDTRFAISTVITIPDSGDPDTIKIQSKGNFIPLGGYSSEFKGTIDGNGYCIIGLRTAVYSESSIDSGLIAYSDGATIRNLGLKGGSSVAVSSSDYACAGGLIGDVRSTKITNSYNTGDVTASTGTDAYADAYAGGLIGYTESTTIITNSYNTGDVTASAGAGADAGGLIGYTESTTITNSHNKGDVTAYADAYAEKYVDKNADAGAYAGAYADADAYASAGGLIGYAGNATISESYNTGGIKARTYAYAYANAHAEAYAHADAGAEAEAYAEAYAGGLIGYAGNATISESYNTGYVTAHTYSRSYAYAYAETYIEQAADPAAYQDAETYAEADAYADAEAYAGGLTGFVNKDAKISITNSYNMGVTYAHADANPYAYPEAKGANPNEASPTFKGVSICTGGLIGYAGNAETTIKSSYAESGKGAGDLVGGSRNPDLDEYSGMKTTTEMKTKATFHEWDFDTIWAIDDAEDVADKKNNGYPYLSSNCASDTVSVEVTSVFEPTEWSVKIFVGDDFVNDIGPSAEVTKGSKVTVVVTPPSDYDMVLLFVNGKDVAFDNNTYVIESVSVDTSILVCFDSDMYVVTAKMADGETSTVSPSMAGVRKEVGEFDFIVQPDGNLIIGSASVSLEDAASVSYDQTTLTVTKVSEGCEVEIGMKVGSHKVNIVSTSGGTVSPTGTQTVEHGSSLSIKMSPDKGYKILDVRVNNSSNDDAIKNGRLTLQNITSDMRVDVSFVKDDSSIVYLNVYAGEGGKAYGSGYYEKGSQVPIFAIADNGYEFKRWSNGSTSATTSVTVIDNMDIQATFEKSSLFGGGSVGNSDNIIYVALVIVVILGIAFVFAWAFTRNKG